MPDSYPQTYFPVLLQGLIAMALAAGLLTVSYLLGQRVRNRVKDMPYESSIVPTGDARQRFSVKFYLVGMLFILFDIEIVFMYPWAVVYRDFITEHGARIFWSMLSFIGIVTLGYVYAVMKGALDWLHEGDDWYQFPADVSAESVGGRLVYFLPGTSSDSPSSAAAG